MKIGETEVLTLQEAATRIGVSPHTLRNQIKNGALHGQVIGRAYVVTASDLAEYDEQRKRPRGFANPDHPFYKRRGGGGRKRNDDSTPSR